MYPVGCEEDACKGSWAAADPGSTVALAGGRKSSASGLSLVFGGLSPAS